MSWVVCSLSCLSCVSKLETCCERAIFEVIWDWSGRIEDAYAECCCARAVVRVGFDRSVERSWVVCFVMVGGSSKF